MRALSLRILIALSVLVFSATAFASNVTVGGTTTFASLDGGPDDADHVVNGVFTVAGDLTVNGSINCNDSGGSTSACAMSFNVAHDLIVNAGGALYAENRSGAGTGGAITLTVGHDLVLHGATATLAAAIISSNAKYSSASTGGAITANVANAVSIENGATIDSGASNAKGGKITIVAGAHVDVDGNILSGPSRTILATRLTGQTLDGGTGNQIGGEISVKSTSTFEPGLTVGSNANIVSQGETGGSGPVTIEGCGVVVKGLVASLAKKDAAARVDIRSGKTITIDARDLGITGATLGRLGHVRVDAPSGSASQHTLDIYAAGQIQILGPSAPSTLYALTGLPGVNDAKSDGSTMHVTSTADSVIASGNVVDDGHTASGDGGGTIEISAKANINLDSARLRVVGDSNTNNNNRNGGYVRVRSYSGNVVWTNGLGDVTPAGSQVSTAQAGTISLTACGTVTTSGSSFPTNGAPVGPFPTTTTGSCSPAAPALPVSEGSLAVCDTPPVADDSSVATNEDTAVLITMTGSDAENDALTFTIVTPPAHGSLSPISNTTATSAQVTYSPNANYNGPDSFTFQADDGKGGTSIGTVTITVTAVNDAPTFNLGANPVTSLEDSGAQSIAAYASSINAGPTADEAGQAVTFTVTNDNNALFSVQPAIAPNGTLTYTAAPNGNGSANISVVAHDDGGTANGGSDTSTTHNFNIFVTAVNDAPSFTKGADVTVLEDSGAFSQSGWATGISAGPSDESGQAVSFVVTNSNNALFAAQPSVASNGTLTFTPAANANGTATVTVAAHDNGGTANGGNDTSASQTFTVTVTAANDAPSFTSGGNVTILEDGAAYSAAWATAISAGPADESSQTVNFTASNDNNALFSTQPSIASNGTLTFALAADANGTATVSVTAHDDGGTANGGSDSSAAQTFTITVTAVNDAPSFTRGADQTSLEDGGAQTVAGWATAVSAGPANESSQTVNFVVTNDNNALFSAQPAVAANGTLTYTASPNASGTATVTVAAHDDGGTANGGVDSSAAQTFTITITAVNDAPSFTKGADQTSLEDGGAQSVAGWATGISAGPADESSQSVSFTATNNNNALFSAQPSVAADGILTYTAAPDAFGTATVSVVAHDNGGTANGGVDTSAAQTFTINVTGVNDAPSFTKGPDINVLSSAGAQSVPSWATAISAGANEGAQTVSFLVSNDNNGVFTAQPAVTSTGTLTFSTVATAPTTTVHVNVVAHDNGGTANGGVDTSAGQTFNINVTHDNQPPVANNDSFDAVGNTELAVGTAGTQPARLSASGSVLGNDTDPDGDTLSASFGSATAGAAVTVNADGSFTYLPPVGFTGDDTFTYIANDGQGHNATGTVTVHVTKRVLYVKNNGGGSTGRVDSPFATLADAQAAAANNDTVYVFTGDGTTTGQDAGFVVNHDGERLIGEGVALTESGTYNASSNPTLRTAGTRPQISNASGDGVKLAGAGSISNVEASGVQITAAGASGIRIADAHGVRIDSNVIGATTSHGVSGVKTSDLTLTGNTVSNSGGSSVSFDTTPLQNEANLTGAVVVTGNTLSTAAVSGISVSNYAGVISNVQISGNTITSSTSDTTSSGSGIRFLTNGSASASASVTRASISNNTLTNFPSGAGIQFQTGNASNGPATVTGTPSNTTNIIAITGNLIAGASTAIPMGTNAILVTMSGAGSGNFDISGNGTAANPVTNIAGAVIGLSVIGNSTATARINDNVIVAHNTAGSQGIAIGVDRLLSVTEAPNLGVTVNGNTISATDGVGINAIVRNTTGSLTAAVTNNIVAAPLSGARSGIRIDSGAATGNVSLCLQLSGNRSAGSGGLTGISLRKQGTNAAVNAYGIKGMAATSSPGVESYVNAQNPLGGGTTLVSATSGFSNCTLP
jgi:hypothetical protein